MSGVFAVTDVQGTEPALLRTYKRAIQSRAEIDTQPANPSGHPIIGWDPAIFAGYRRYSDSTVENAIPGILSYSGPTPAGGGDVYRGFDVPGDIWQFFGYPRHPVWGEGTGTGVTVAPPVQDPPIAAYSLMATPNTVCAGGVLAVSWSKPAGASPGFIGLYASERAAEGNYLQYRYPSAAGDTGTIAFPVPLSPGTYWLGWVSDSSRKFEVKTSFSTRPAPSALSTTPAPPSATGYSLAAETGFVCPGSPITVSWTRPAGSPSGFVGLYSSANLAPFAYIDYKYPSSGGNNGTITFTAPLSAGDYWIAWVSEDDVSFKAKATFVVGN
jgi:hypothetical protein